EGERRDDRDDRQHDAPGPESAAVVALDIREDAGQERGEPGVDAHVSEEHALWRERDLEALDPVDLLGDHVVRADRNERDAEHEELRLDRLRAERVDLPEEHGADPHGLRLYGNTEPTPGEEGAG